MSMSKQLSRGVFNHVYYSCRRNGTRVVKQNPAYSSTRQMHAIQNPKNYLMTNTTTRTASLKFLFPALKRVSMVHYGTDDTSRLGKEHIKNDKRNKPVKAKPEIEYRGMRTEDLNAIREQVCEEYSTEMVCKHLNLDYSGNGIQYIDYQLRHGLTDDVSIVAVDKNTGKMAGCLVCQVENIERANGKKKEIKTWSPELQAYEMLADQVRGDVDLYDHFKVDRILQIGIGCVSQTYRNQNLVTMIIDEAIERAKQNQVPMVVLETSSSFTRRAAEKLGYTVFAEKRFDEMMYRGKPFILGEELHPTFCVWTKMLK